MQNNIDSYIVELNQQYATGKAHEHSYRSAMQNLLKALLSKSYTVVNEPTRETCGAPDFIILKGETPIAYLETKDLQDSDLDGKKEHKEQFDRYRASLDHIIFTDYLDFHLYENGEYVDAVRLADIRGGKIVLLEESTDKFLQLIKHLADAAPQRITSPSRLAKVMAGKARLLANVIEQALENDKEQTSELVIQMNVFREYLIHDLNEKTFADIYAQTIAYGLFSARLNDKTPEDFSRNEANELIPKSNPLLRKIFNNIAGYDVDQRIAWIVDDLVAAFRVTDMERVMKDFKQGTQQNDPLMHFYEDFLGEYDSKLKKSRGVYYTPQPVVDFIVRAVDDILKRDFNLPMGLADNSMIDHEVVNEQYVKAKKGLKEVPKTIRKRMHRVQILDPATGTGTFLAAVIRQIYANMDGQRGAWNSYVEQHLLPRLNGFELMMASYTVAHLKLNMVLRETGYTPQSDQRLRVYLTNSLEEFNADTGTLFAAAISQEANDASRIKRDCPVMVMMGNPPYSISSNNNGSWITILLESYKRDLNERNIQPLSDDYIKFIRLGQEYISKNGEGILAFICNNSFLDGIIHRQMRKELMNTFDKIYVFNLHGNNRKNEVSPDGSKDENVFDIMQGVSINIFYRGKKNTPDSCQLFYCDLFGNRDNKYEFLNNHNLGNVEWKELHPEGPYNFFVPKNFSEKEEYEKGFKVDELFIVQSTGMTTCKDSVNYWNNKKEVCKMTDDLLNMNDDVFRNAYKVGSDSRDWSVSRAKEDVAGSIKTGQYSIEKIEYRQFDYKYVFFSGRTNGIVAWPRYRSLHHMIGGQNVSLIVPRQTSQDWRHVFATTYITDMNILASAKVLGAGVQFPLWVYPAEDGSIFGELGEKRTPNFNIEVLQSIETALGESVEPQQLFDYIYAVLHSPNYRTQYKEFLKIDFPRIPYPESKEEYHRLADLGGQLRRLHLMQDVPTPQHAKFDNEGSNIVDKLEYKEGCVWINKEQCFADVPETAWNFYIGGYQPAQKWLKDRKGRTLTFDDISHYRKIITILVETDRLMNEIDLNINN